MGNIFISYSRQDYEDFVRLFREDLQREGIQVWIDQQNLRFGTPDWEQAIRDAIKAANAVLFVATLDSRQSDYVRDELRIANMERTPIYPIWAKGEDGRFMDCVPMGFGSVQAVDARGMAKYRTALKTIVQTLRGDTTLPTLPLDTAISADLTTPPSGTTPISKASVNPYKGLEAFTEIDQRYFFGREALSDTIATNIKSIALSNSRLLAVVGASGSGKSSVVKAGLIPRLRHASGWLLLDPMTPGENPVKTLALKLAMHLSERSGMSIIQDLRDPSTAGLDFLARILADKGYSHVLLFIDQFEELFTRILDENERQHFINLLVTAATEPSGSLVVVLTLRADFYDRPMNYADLGELINQHNQSVLPMKLSELADAIERPAYMPEVGLKFEPGLVAELVFALRGKKEALAGALPLLQFCLERLYEERDGNLLTHAAYEKMGKLEGAIGTYAEAVFATLDEDAQNALGKVFLALVTVDERGTPTRSRVPLTKIAQSDETTHLVEALIEARLLITDQDESSMAVVEVAHEALLRTWTRLVDWIATVADDLRLRDRVIQAAHEWDAAGRPDGWLWPYERMQHVYEMQARVNPGLDIITTAFLRPEWQRLFEEFTRQGTKSHRKLTIIDRWGEIGELAIPTIMEAFEYMGGRTDDETDESIRNALSPYFELAIDDMIRLLTHPKSWLRQSAAWVIEDCSNKKTVPALLKLLEDTDSRKRILAAYVLGNICYRKTLPALINAFHDDNDLVRCMVIRALGKIGDHDLIPWILKALNDTDGDIRWIAVWALGQIGDPSVGPDLLELMKDETIYVRWAAAEALGEICYVQAVPFLINVLGDDLKQARLSSARALGKIGDSQAMQYLIPLLQDTDDTGDGERASNEAATALERIGTLEAMAALEVWRTSNPELYTLWQRYREQESDFEPARDWMFDLWD